MRSIKHSFSLLAAAAASTLLLAACGGGGGNDTSTGGNNGGGLGGSTSTMDATSYAGVAQPVADSVVAASSAATLPVALLGGSASAGGVARSFSLPAWSRSVAARAAQADRARALAVQSTTEACSGGGTLTVSINDADNNGDISLNDTVTLSAASCVDSGTTLSGGVTVHVDAFSVSAGQSQGRVTMSLNFNGFTIDGTKLDGAAVVDLTHAAGTDTLSFQYKGATVTTASRTVTLDYLVRLSLPGTGGGTSSLNGNVHFGSDGYALKQTQAFQLDAQDLLPSSGRLGVTDAGGARVDLVAGPQFFTYEFYKAGNTTTTPDATQTGTQIR